MEPATLTLLFAGAAVSIQAPSREDVEDHLRSRATQWSEDQIDVLSDVVYDRAAAYDLDPELVLAVMSVESGFRLRARSRVGALGLMQVMPSTGEMYARASGVRWRGERTLYDPVANIRIGTRYLAWLLDEFNGDLPLALTSYCHGIGHVKRTLRARGRLPYRTLRYSRKVLKQLVGLRRARRTRARSYAARAPDRYRWNGHRDHAREWNARGRRRRWSSRRSVSTRREGVRRGGWSRRPEGVEDVPLVHDGWRRYAGAIIRTR